MANARTSRNLDWQSLQAAMSRFDDKLDKNNQLASDLRVEMAKLDGRISTHESNVKTGMAELSGKMEQARSAIELKAERDNSLLVIDATKTKGSFSQFRTKDAVRWGVLIAIGMICLQILAGIAKDLLVPLFKK